MGATVDSDVPDDVVLGSLVSPVGRLSVAVTRYGLAALRWAEPEEVATRTGLPVLDLPDRAVPVLAQLDEYFRDQRREFDFPLDWRHTALPQRTVLQTLEATVRHGSTITYGELARRSRTGIPARGIGAIMGSNPIPIVVPCHRVVAQDGLGGYSGGSGGDGLEVKRWLLTMEGALQPTLGWDQAALSR